MDPVLSLLSTWVPWTALNCSELLGTAPYSHRATQGCVRCELLPPEATTVGMGEGPEEGGREWVEGGREGLGGGWEGGRGGWEGEGPVEGGVEVGRGSDVSHQRKRRQLTAVLIKQHSIVALASAPMLARRSRLP